MLSEKIEKFNLVLGSKSPRREHLLKALGLDFSVNVIPGIEEKYPQNIEPEQIPLYLSELKAEAYKQSMKDSDILITADTIVLLKGRVVEKPVDMIEAKLFLHELSGNMHTVISGVSITSKKKQVSFRTYTDVYFSVLSDNEIEYYVETFQPLDKAGAYGIQEWIGYIGVEKINGSFFNVMGLPIHKLYQELNAFIDE